jgi:hypothetical protein
VNSKALMHLVGIDPTKRDEVKEFARKLSADEVPIPDDWNYLVVSSNKRCEWFHVKDFINRQLHGMKFERVSLLFGDNPPPGDKFMFSDIKGTGDGKEKSWGFDFRERVVAQIGGNNFFVIRVNPEHVKSNRVHLVSAFPVPRRAVEDAIPDRFIDSSVDIVERVIFGNLKYSLIRRRKGGLV